MLGNTNGIKMIRFSMENAIENETVELMNNKPTDSKGESPADIK